MCFIMAEERTHSIRWYQLSYHISDDLTCYLWLKRGGPNAILQVSYALLF